MRYKGHSRSFFWKRNVLMVLFAGVFLVSAQLIPASVFAWGITYAPPVKVVTQNLYLGADIFKALEADPDDPLSLPKKVREIYLEIVNTDFNERAGAIADQIEATMPDLVGLQEVSIIISVVRRRTPDRP